MAEEKTTLPAAGAPDQKTRPAVGKKKAWRSLTFAKIFIRCTFNNTIVTLTDERGAVLLWSSAGECGFKGTKKGTPYAAGVTAAKIAKRALEMGVKQVAVFIRGPGPGRETAVRSLGTAGLMVVSLKDTTPLPHNGCRPPKARRV